MDLKEATIWDKIKKKDLATFEHYYHLHFKTFFLMACRYLKDSSQATEIVNDVFLKIWEDGEKISIESSLKAYMYKAIINRCLNAIQKNKRESAHLSDLSFFPDESYELQQIEENELRTQLYAAIDMLPEQCKKVFEMSRFEKMKQQEIADALGISLKTVKNHITIALKRVGKAVENYILWIIILFVNIFGIH